MDTVISQKGLPLQDAAHPNDQSHSNPEGLPVLRVSPEEVAPFIENSPDFLETQVLIRRFIEFRETRHPFYFDQEDFDAVVRWKLRKQFGRVAGRLKLNSYSTIRAVTQAAFSVRSDDADHELRVRVSLLCALDGIDIGVASAILALTFPESYPVIDFRGWRQAYRQDTPRRTFTLSHYAHYKNDCTRLALSLGVTPQSVDLALWAKDLAEHPVPSRKRRVLNDALYIDDTTHNADWIKSRYHARISCEEALTGRAPINNGPTPNVRHLS